MLTPQNELELRTAYASEPDPLYPGAFRWLGVKPLKRARIATNLAPRAREHLGRKSRFFVVGFDCPNLTEPSYTPWEAFLVDASKQGCKVSYYLGKRSNAVIQRFQQIATKSKARPGQIRLYIRDHKGSPLAESYADQWKRFHFVVFENPRQLWLETDHPEGETTAYNCYYLPPSKARNEPLLDTFRSRFEMVVTECATLAFES